MATWRDPVLAIVLLLAACVAPFMVGSYSVEVFILFLINLILVSSYRILTTTGDWSLSHVVMMGVGAYATALLSKWWGLSIFLTVPLSAVVAAAVGLMVVTPLLRTKGFGFFIASFALGELIRLCWVKFRDPFGGPRGMIGIPSGELGSIDFFEPIPYYFFVLLVTTVCLVVIYRIDRSRIGKTFKAIYTDEGLAESLGIAVQRYRALAFTTGTFFAGIAGSLLAHRLGAIDPKNFDVNAMVYLIIWIVVGGTSTFWGPIIGLTVMTLVFEWTRPLLEWRPLLFGGILIVFLIFQPAGLEGLYQSIKGRLAGTGTKQADQQTPSGSSTS